MAAELNLLDDEGENQAVRSFLMQYSCDRAVTVDQMRKHMDLCGWSGCWPEFVEKAGSKEHLTKAGAQIWIRHLIDMERRAAPSASASDELPEPEFKAYEYSADAKVWSEDEVRAILAADRARQGEPDAFMVVLSGGEPVAMNFQRVNAEAKLREWEGAGEVVPLYRAAIKAPAPADAPWHDAVLAETITDPDAKAVYWFSILTKCAQLLNLPDDEPIPSGVLAAVEKLVAAPINYLTRQK